MQGFTPETSFGPDAAARYDEPLRGDEDAGVDFLVDLAPGRDALEFAIGTGRMAMPLSHRGVRVDGIELSQAMVDLLRSRSGGAGLDVRARTRRPGSPPTPMPAPNRSKPQPSPSMCVRTTR